MFENMTSEELADQERRWEVRAAIYHDRITDIDRRIDALEAERAQLAGEVLRCHTSAAVFRIAQVPTS